MGGGHGGGGAAPRRVRAAGQLSCCPSHTVLLQVLHRADDMAPGEVAPYRVRLEDGSELTVLTDEGSEIVGANSHGDEEDGEEAGEGCEAQAAPQQQQQFRVQVPDGVHAGQVTDACLCLYLCIPLPLPL